MKLFGVLILLGLYACSDNSDLANDKTLADTKWDLQSFEIIGVEESAIGSQGMIIIFAENDSLEGGSMTIEGDLSVPGNSYGGVYELGLNDSIEITHFYTTYVGLPPESRYEEYIQAIKNASAYEIEGDKLRIFYDDKTKALNFMAD